MTTCHEISSSHRVDNAVVPQHPHLKHHRSTHERRHP